jgi:hypothetical protein
VIVQQRWQPVASIDINGMLHLEAQRMMLLGLLLVQV